MFTQAIFANQRRNQVGLRLQQRCEAGIFGSGARQVLIAGALGGGYLSGERLARHGAKLAQGGST